MTSHDAILKPDERFVRFEGERVPLWGPSRSARTSQIPTGQLLRSPRINSHTIPRLTCRWLSRSIIISPPSRAFPPYGRNHAHLSRARKKSKSPLCPTVLSHTWDRTAHRRSPPLHHTRDRTCSVPRWWTHRRLSCHDLHGHDSSPRRSRLLRWSNR